MRASTRFFGYALARFPPVSVSCQQHPLAHVGHHLRQGVVRLAYQRGQHDLLLRIGYGAELGALRRVALRAEVELLDFPRLLDLLGLDAGRNVGVGQLM